MHHSQPLLTAAAAAISLTLSTLPLPLQPPLPTPAPAAALVQIRPTPQLVETALPPIVGVAKSPIHDYGHVPTLDDAHVEYVLALRLVTSVMLGVMVGVERRATRLHLGVRSVTILSLSAALVGVVASCLPVLAVDAVAVGLGGLVGAGTYLTAVVRGERRNVAGMAVVVGGAIAMGLACGFGSSLLSAVCYLVLIGVMRADRGKDRRRERVWRVRGEEDGVVFRIRRMEGEEKARKERVSL